MSRTEPLAAASDASRLVHKHDRAAHFGVHVPQPLKQHSANAVGGKLDGNLIHLHRLHVDDERDGVYGSNPEPQRNLDLPTVTMSRAGHALLELKVDWDRGLERQAVRCEVDARPNLAGA